MCFMKRIKKLIKNKIFIIVSIITISIVLIYLLGYLILSYSFKINGENRIYISYKDSYKEQGVKLNLLGFDLSKNIKTKSNIEDHKLGSYKVTYTFSYFFSKIRKTKIVNIVDKDLPNIELVGEKEINICPNTKYEDEGYKAFDEYDGDLTNKVVISEDDSEVHYEVLDSSGNKYSINRTIIREDTEAPIISLKGNNTIYVRKGSKYYEPGYNISDNCDENLTVDVTDNININQDGKYIVTYKAIDSSGNASEVIRNIVVYTDDKIGVVYLTFDDGPSDTGSTEKILNILSEEGVKATFFVTGNGPDYLIKREYNDGHTVALHTNTHNYATVYSSVDNYYNDLNAVKSRVYNITGVNSNIIRFPGGSNNTVSNRYSPGIMDILVKDVTNNGYIYFDWNVSSGDAGGCTTSSCVYSNVVNKLSKNRINVVLMHDIKMYTANAIRDIIEYCKSNGYVFKVLDSTTPQVKFK